MLTRAITFTLFLSIFLSPAPVPEFYPSARKPHIIPVNFLIKTSNVSILFEI